MKRKITFQYAWIALVAALLDRATKIWLPKNPCEIKGLLKFVPAEMNAGISFSLFENGGWALTTAITALVMCLALWLLLDAKMLKTQRICMCMALGGAIGNLFDRLVYGAVIDFITLPFLDLTVFNLADVFITVGAVIALLAMLIEEKRNHAGKSV